MLSMPQELRAETLLTAIDLFAEQVGQIKISADEHRKLDGFIKLIVHHARLLKGMPLEASPFISAGPMTAFDQRPVPSNVIPFRARR